MSAVQPLARRVEAVIRRVFELPADKLHDETRRGDFERWDSLGHLTLVEALRLEFDVEIPPEEALAMETIADVKRIVAYLVNGEPPT